MDMKYMSLFDLAIGGIPALLFCAWQWVSINREIARDKAAKAADRAAPQDRVPVTDDQSSSGMRLD